MSGLELIEAAAAILPAAVLQAAEAGPRLSKSIYISVDTVSSADKGSARVGTHVKTTSQVIHEISGVFCQEETAKLVSKRAIKTAYDAAKECEEIFEELRGWLGRPIDEKEVFNSKRRNQMFSELNLRSSKALCLA